MDIENELIRLHLLEEPRQLASRRVEDLDAHLAPTDGQQRAIFTEGDALEPVNRRVEGEWLSIQTSIENTERGPRRHCHPASLGIEGGGLAAGDAANWLPVGAAKPGRPGEDHLAATAHRERPAKINLLRDDLAAGVDVVNDHKSSVADDREQPTIAAELHRLPSCGAPAVERRKLPA